MSLYGRVHQAGTTELRNKGSALEATWQAGNTNVFLNTPGLFKPTLAAPMFDLIYSSEP